MATFRRVLELGGGRFSTPLFLNSSVFPSVERVLTIENDLDWAREIEGLVGNRPTHELCVVNGAIASEIARFGVEEFDLIFVDDSRTISERVNTLKESARFVSAGAVVVVHDFEAPAYQLAAAGFRNRLLVTGFYPATGILWNDAPLNACQLEMLCTIVRLSAAWTRPDDVSTWCERFAGISGP